VADRVLTPEHFKGHTAGPWRVAPDSVMTTMNRIWEPGGCDVACCEGDGSIGGEERAANERLIAAAPELLASRELLRARVAAMEPVVEAAKAWRDADGCDPETCGRTRCPDCAEAGRTENNLWLAVDAYRAHALDEEDGR